jgi:beta-galactosidase/beta-glucuronidase
MRKLQYLFFVLLLVLLGSCSHKFDSNILGLEFYQWNLWEDNGAEPGNDLPSCGWDDLHRGKGVLVRIPASIEEHFNDVKDADVYWYHCRFTLPEQWEGRAISMVLEGAGPHIKLFLNQEAVGSFQNEDGAFEMDVSEVIYYTRDNHLSIRVSDIQEGLPGKLNGITGMVLVKSKE